MQHSQRGPNFPQTRVSSEKSVRRGYSQPREGPHRPKGPCPPRGAPLPPPELAGRGHRPVGLRFSKRTASSGRGGVGCAGQRGPGTRARTERGTHHFLVGSLRSRARGARGPPGRWRRRRQPGSGGRGDEPARESTGSHIPGRAVRPGRRSGPGRARTPPTAPSPAPRGGAGRSPALPAGAGSHRPEAGAVRGRSGTRPSPPWGECLGRPRLRPTPGHPSLHFPGPGGTRGKFRSRWWGSVPHVRLSLSLGACRVSQPWVVERGATSPIRDGQV